MPSSAWKGELLNQTGCPTIGEALTLGEMRKQGPQQKHCFSVQKSVLILKECILMKFKFALFGSFSITDLQKDHNIFLSSLTLANRKCSKTISNI